LDINYQSVSQNNTTIRKRAVLALVLAAAFVAIAPFCILQGLFPHRVVALAACAIAPTGLAAIILGFAAPNKSPGEKLIRKVSLGLIAAGLFALLYFSGK
jgi:hypothetical protein